MDSCWMTKIATRSTTATTMTTRVLRLSFLLLSTLGWIRKVRSDALTSKFNVLIPKELKKDQGYDHREAMFGIPPYGGTIQQQVYYAKSTFCDPTREQNHDWKAPFILMVDRGGCSFVQKVRNVQRAGAAAVLIADDICVCGHPSCPERPGFDEETKQDNICQPQEPIMADDGSGSDITIPSFLLFKEDSEPIIHSLLSGAHMLVQMAFSVPAPDSRVEYDLWTSPADALTRGLQEDFFSAVKALKDHAFFTPHMYIYDGVYAGCHGDDGNDLCLDLCTNAGRYCSIDLDLHSGASGAQVVTEALRRICIWNLYGQQDGIGLPWWNYVRQFTQTCDNTDFKDGGKQFSSRECISKAMEIVGVDLAKVEDCMEKSGGTDEDVSNALLDKELTDQAASGVVVVPSLLVNQAVIRGFLNFETTFKAICAGFAPGSVPLVCQECAICPDEKKCVQQGFCSSGSSLVGGVADTVSFGTFTITLFFLILVFAAAGYFQHVRQQEYMHGQIQSIVQEYMPIESQNRNVSTSLALDEEDGEQGFGTPDSPEDEDGKPNGRSSFSIP